jgi:hypothetical protein
MSQLGSLKTLVGIQVVSDVFYGGESSASLIKPAGEFSLFHPRLYFPA